MQNHINNYLKFCKLAKQQAKSTLDNKKYSLQIFIGESEIDSPENITEEIILEFLNNWKENKFWSHNTYINYFKYIKWFSDYLIQKEILFKNPFKDLKFPARKKSLPKRLSEDDARKLLYSAYSYNWTYAFEKERNHAIISTFLYSWLRISELINLEYFDVNTNDWTILIRSWKWEKDRLVPMVLKLKTILKKYEKDKERLNKKSIPYFWSIRSDKKLTKKNIYSFLEKIKKDSKVNFTAHQLRHTFASSALDNWLDIYAVKECLWHSNVTTTQIYTQMTQKTLKDRMVRLEMY